MEPRAELRRLSAELRFVKLEFQRHRGEALEAVAELHFRLDSLAAVVNRVLDRVRSLQEQLKFLTGVPDTTDSPHEPQEALDFHSLD